MIYKESWCQIAGVDCLYEFCGSNFKNSKEGSQDCICFYIKQVSLATNQVDEAYLIIIRWTQHKRKKIINKNDNIEGGILLIFMNLCMRSKYLYGNQMSVCLLSNITL